MIPLAHQVDTEASIAVVGGGGWIGRHTIDAVNSSGHRVRATSRQSCPFSLRREVTWVTTSSEPTVAELIDCLRGCDAVLNTAGAAHVVEGRHAGDAVFANEVLPGLIAAAASRLGLRRMVHLSSIKAAGEGGPRPLHSADAPAPSSRYGQSKLKGELAAKNELSGKGTQLVIVRPPMVYGRGAHANFRRLLAHVNSRRPLPLPYPYPRRSLIYIENLASLLAHLTSTSLVPAHVVHMADTPHLTTRHLVKQLAGAIGVPGRVIPVPLRLIAPIARAVGRGQDMARLGEELVVEPSPPEDIAGWRAPFPNHVGFRRMLMVYS